MICSLCKKTKLIARNLVLGVCTTCADAAAIVALPPSTRPARACRQCDGRSFVRVVPREFSATGSHPAYAVHTPTVRKLAFYNACDVSPPDPSAGQGLMEMFICRSCEAVEWYCHGAAQLPIGPAYNTELVEYLADGAYR